MSEITYCTVKEHRMLNKYGIDICPKCGKQTELFDPAKHGKSQGGRPPIYNDETGPELMQAKIDAYFKKCDKGKTVTKITKAGNEVTVKRRIPKLMSGLCLAIGFKSRTSLLNYKEKDERFMDVITRARLQCEDDLIEGALIGDYESKMSGLVAQTNYDHSTKAKDEVKTEETITFSRISYKGASSEQFDTPDSSPNAADPPADKA